MTVGDFCAALAVARLDGVAVDPQPPRLVFITCRSAQVRCHIFENEWLAYAKGNPPRSFFPMDEPEGADPLAPELVRRLLIEALAWSLTAEPLPPEAPQIQHALRAGGVWGEVVRAHLTTRLNTLTTICELDEVVVWDEAAALAAALGTKEVT